MNGRFVILPSALQTFSRLTDAIDSVRDDLVYILEYGEQKLIPSTSDETAFSHYRGDILHFSLDKYFCWEPHDEATWFRLRSFTLLVNPNTDVIFHVICDSHRLSDSQPIASQRRFIRRRRTALSDEERAALRALKAQYHNVKF